MAKPHYVIRRSRSGRFNFTLITDAGRLTGFVSTEFEGQSSLEIERQARDKIRAIARSFATANGLALAEGAEPKNETETPIAHSVGELAT